MSAEPIKDVPATEPVATEPATTTALPEPVADSKPTEDTPAVTEAAPATTETPAAVEAPTEAEATTTETKAAEPITEGSLGYKAPGLIKSLRFSKKYFWLGEEPIEDSSLATYLRGEKGDVAHANAAHASQTGKGLLLFAKRVEDRASPAGILNLAEATDIVKEEPSEFSFKLHGHKHTFQASTKAERDSWLVAIEKAAGEAATAHEGITSSEGYKSKHSKFSKPAGALAAVPTTKTSPKPEDKVHDGTEPTSSTVAATSEPIKAEKAEKSRSQSRKRQSIFGSFLNKAEEKKDIKKEERAEKKAEKEAEKEEKKEDKAVAQDEPIAIEQRVETGAAPDVAPTSIDGAQETKPVDETPATTTTATAEPTPSPNPLKSKRGSVFGSFFKNSPKKEETKTDAAPAVPAKDTEPVAAEAPQLDAIDTAAPATTTSAETTAAPATEPTTETAVPAATKETPAATSPKEKGGFLGFFKQKEAQLEAKKEEKKEEKAEKKEEDEAVKEAKKSEETPAVTPAAATTTPSAEPKDKRRSSFFGSLASKKEKKAETTSDGEKSDGEKKPANLKGIFRSLSRGTKPTTGPVTDSSAPPAAPAKDTEAVTDEAPVAQSTETPAAPLTNGESSAVAAAEPEIPAAEPIATQPTVTASA